MGSSAPLRWRLRGRRLAERLADPFDWLYRRLKGLSDLPPYSLRQRAGGASGFGDVGPWYLEQLDRLGLLRPQGRILDVGCGCGRLAASFAASPRIAELGIGYVGMDVDRRAIAWCRKAVARDRPGFTFYHADVRNPYYNARGRLDPAAYVFPHTDGAFDLILLSSVFTHLLEGEVSHYLREIRRLLCPSGRAYATFFTFGEAPGPTSGKRRHPVEFRHRRGHYALYSEELPQAAVAYEVGFLAGLVDSAGLAITGEILLGIQDVLILAPAGATAFG